MAVKDYYRIIGVETNATNEEIKKAYRRLAMSLHPDRNQNDPRCEERLKEVNEAYGVIGNGIKRQRYDMMRQRPSMDEIFEREPEDLTDGIMVIFREIFGGGTNSYRPGGCRGCGFGRRGCGRRNWRS